MHMGKVLKSISEKIRGVFGPLTQMWAMFEQERSKVQAQAGEEDPFKEMSDLFEKSILMLCQTVHLMNYQRRHDVLNV